MRKIWEDYRWIPATAVGSAVFALGFSLFLQPNEISPGGISGLALVAVELLGYGISFSGDNMHVVVPTWRSTGDVSIQADIMEEVARMYGYENFEAEPITTTFDGAINQLDKDLERRIIADEDWWKLRQWRQFSDKGNPNDDRPASGWLFNVIMGKHANAVAAYPGPVIRPR